MIWTVLFHIFSFSYDQELSHRKCWPQTNVECFNINEIFLFWWMGFKWDVLPIWQIIRIPRESGQRLGVSINHYLWINIEVPNLKSDKFQGFASKYTFFLRHMLATGRVGWYTLQQLTSGSYMNKIISTESWISLFNVKHLAVPLDLKMT